MTYTFPELEKYEPPTAEQIRWLMRAGVQAPALYEPSVIVTAHGIKADDGCFEETADGPTWLVFREELDVIYWQPKSGETATWNNRAFALGEAAIGNPATYSFDCYLNIYGTPLDWLAAGRDGIVVIRWEWAFDMLRDAHRIAVAESQLFAYRRHMKPQRQPELAVITEHRKAAA